MRVIAVVLPNGGQHTVVIGVQIKPLLRGVAGNVRQEKAGGDEEWLVVRSLLDLLDRP